MNAKKIGIMVATPVRYWKGVEQFHPEFQALLNRLAELSADETCPYEFIFSTCTGGIVRARNRMVGNFLRLREESPSLKWLVWLDDDVCCAAEDIMRLVGHKEPICGAMYTTRDENERWVANFMYDAVVQSGGVKDGLLQVIECGTGLKAYFWQVFTNLQTVYPCIRYFERDTGLEQWGYFQQVIMNEDAPSEDYFLDWLCRQAAAQVKGLGIFVDTKIRVRHRDSQGVTYPKGDWPPIPGVEDSK